MGSCLSQSFSSSSPINCCSAYLWCNYYLVSFLSLARELFLFCFLLVSYYRARAVFYVTTSSRVLWVFVLHFGQRLWFLFLPGHWFSWPPCYFRHSLFVILSTPASQLTFYAIASPCPC